MVLVKILPSDPDPDNLNHSAFFTVAVLEVLGNSTLTVGLFLIGSGVLLIHSLKMYQVIYSSVIVFTAILSSILLRKQLSRLQWVAVIVITLGLSISALSSSTSKASNPILGFFVCLAGTLFLAGVYTLNEHHLSTANRNYATPTPHQQSFYVGLYSTILILIVILFVSIPSISELPLLRSSVISGYLSLILASFGHSLAYFELVKSTGAVATVIPIN
jgi:drug/metabolite transporter (DMT)-like permease